MVVVTELDNSFWGLVLNGSSRVEVKGDKVLTISMAALDTSVPSKLIL